MQLFNGNEKIELAKEKNKIQVRLSKTRIGRAHVWNSSHNVASRMPYH